MKSIIIKKNLNLKDGTVLPIGTELSFVRPHAEKPTLGYFAARDREYREFCLRYSGIMKAPSLKVLERMSDDGVCKTVLGAKAEPDGYGPHGEPSWLLALGLI